MQHRSLVGFFCSLCVHGMLAGAVIWALQKQDSANAFTSDVVSTHISMEMLMATVAEEPAPAPEPQATPEPEAKEEVADPTKKEIEKTPEKVKEKPKEKPKDKPKPKEKPKETVKKVSPKPVDPPPFAVKAEQTANGNAQVNSKASGVANATSTNPNLAGTGSSSSDIAAYQTALRREIERHKKYSQRAKMMRKQGVVTIAFTVETNGAITGARIVNSSGSEDLDNAALAAVQSAKSVGPRPAGMSSSLTVPIKFTLQ